MTSLINPSNPTEGQATTASVRANFLAAKNEIEELYNNRASESYANLAAFPVTGNVNKFYIAQDTGLVYRWDGAAYVQIAPGSGTNGVIFIGSMNVADLPILPVDRPAIAVAQDCVWSGGVGGLVRWGGLFWRDEDNNFATTSPIVHRAFGGAVAGGLVIPPGAGPSSNFLGREQDFLFFVDKATSSTILGTGLTGQGAFGAFDADNGVGPQVPAGTTGSIEVTLNPTRTQIKHLILIFQNVPVMIRLEADQGAGYFTVFEDNNPSSQFTNAYATAYSRSLIGSAIDGSTVTQKLRISITAQPSVDTFIRTWAMFQYAQKPHFNYLLYRDGTGDMWGDLNFRKGSAAQVGTTDDFDLQFKRNNAVIATLTASGLNAIKLFYDGQDTDLRYILNNNGAQMPSFTVATLPTASPVGRQIYVTNESGGAVLAFSDGTNWRRVTDRAIVT